MTKESWVPVIGYEGLYEVSDLGRFRSLTRPNKPEGVVSQREKTGGYLNVSLCKDGVKKEYRSHKIMLESFRCPESNNAQVNHINGVKTDNRLENLEWSTPSKNSLHRSRVLGKNRGEYHGLSKLSEDSVLEIVRLRALGASQKFVATVFGVSKHTIYCIENGITWGWLTGIKLDE